MYSSRSKIEDILKKKEKKKPKKKESQIFDKPKANKSINSSQSRKLTYKQKFNKKYKQPLNKSNTLKEISELSKVQLIILKEVYNRGIGAAKTAGISRPNVQSKEQWAYGRVYAFIIKYYNKKEPQDQDKDLMREVDLDFQ